MHPKALLSLFLLLIVHSGIAQSSVAKFDNAFALRDGIYTSYQELLNNTPGFPDCILQSTSYIENDPDKIKTTRLNYYKAGDENNVLKYTSPLFATVLKGKLNVYYQKELTPVYSKGTVCTFIYTKDPVTYNKNNINTAPFYSSSQGQLYANPHRGYQSFVCMLDIQTGEVKKLTKENLGLTIARDSVLYQQFLKIKPGRKNKNLFKYIAEFNSRNVTFLPTRIDMSTTEEE
ncbi:MAG TPA: hypothetical protein VK796_03490 [Cytophaga sp.]|jgi:hypothetical protein|nr:hypothetical protein [Cytophaga sp.]